MANCRRLCERCNVRMESQEDGTGALLICPKCGKSEAFYFGFVNQLLATMVAMDIGAAQ